ncbi:FERM domain-containing protein 8 isoform X2 [Neocloeon triangulifer]|nr:FERM domain-containing protein 8 isoform X2 [Neocloeon triangulifer]XP_059473359.1 FERM domain-containing protein 8 isoform X2 [Neocloeon triangulifer]
MAAVDGREDSLSNRCGHSDADAQTQGTFITVIPVDYSRRTPYPTTTTDYLVDQYSEYLRERARDEYLRGDYNINSDPQYEDAGPMYALAQRYAAEPLASYNTMTQEREWDPRSLAQQVANQVVPQAPSVQQQQVHPDAQTINEQLVAKLQQQCQQQQQQQLANDKAIPPPKKTIQMAVFLFSPVVLSMEAPRQIMASELTALVMQEEQLGLPRNASDVFSIWMTSGLLEIQLKPNHKPLEVRQNWQYLLSRFSDASESRKERDEPRIALQRNVFLSRVEEERIKEQKVLELLYEEAKYNVLEGRYPCEVSHYIMLGGLQARIELGPYDPHHHTPEFFRQQHGDFLPAHVRKAAGWAWLPVSSKRSPEVRLLEAFKSVPAATPVKRLIRKYLEFCWALPFYGSAFFNGQIEQPVRGLTSLITHQDIPVLVAVNEKGVYVIDEIQCTILLGLKYEELSWEYARPSQEDSPDCLPCLFIQFMVVENGARVSKILQVFSKQAIMMDALISTYVDRLKQRASEEAEKGTFDAATDTDELHAPLRTPVRREITPQSCLSNKLSRLTLATFDDDGRCIGQMGSWSFSH